MPQCRFRPGRARSEKNIQPKLGQTAQRESPPVLAGLDRFDRQGADPHPSGTPSNRRAIVPNDARPTGFLTDTRSCRRRRAHKWRGNVVLVHANCAGFSPILQTLSRWRKLEIPTINLRLSHFGTFLVSTRAAGAGRNFRTGARVEIPPTRRAVFRAGSNLREGRGVACASPGKLCSVIFRPPSGIRSGRVVIAFAGTTRGRPSLGSSGREFLRRGGGIRETPRESRRVG